MNMIRVETVPMGFLVVSAQDSTRTLFVQLDLDFPGLATTFGWQACSCGGTDGTVDCKHRKASDMIASAYNYLRDHEGETVPDPGYFE
jgi:hypothetical protein